MLILFIYLILHDIVLLSLPQSLSILRFCYVSSHLKQPPKQQRLRATYAAMLSTEAIAT